jgi:hypothetical protein
MHVPKIWCDEKFWKVFGFWMQPNEALLLEVEAHERSYKTACKSSF